MRVVYSLFLSKDANGAGHLQQEPRLHCSDILKLIVNDNFVNFSSVVVRCAELGQVGPFSETIPSEIDYDLWMGAYAETYLHITQSKSGRSRAALAPWSLNAFACSPACFEAWLEAFVLFPSPFVRQVLRRAREGQSNSPTCGRNSGEAVL